LPLYQRLKEAAYIAAAVQRIEYRISSAPTRTHSAGKKSLI